MHRIKKAKTWGHENSKVDIKDETLMETKIGENDKSIE